MLLFSLLDPAGPPEALSRRQGCDTDLRRPLGVALCGRVSARIVADLRQGPATEVEVVLVVVLVELVVGGSSAPLSDHVFMSVKVSVMPASR